MLCNQQSGNDWLHALSLAHVGGLSVPAALTTSIVQQTHPRRAANSTIPQTALSGTFVLWFTFCQTLLKGTAPSRLNAHSMRALLVTDSEPTRQCVEDEL